MRRRRRRFRGAGGSAEREFNRQLRQNIRDEWLTWTLVSVGVVGFAAWSLLVDGMAARFLAAAAGALLGGMFVIYSLGGHISAFRWWLGAEGERDTAKEIEQLGPEWHCEHDIEHEKGNWDHVLVGPPGVFLLDSKVLHNEAVASDDALRTGRLYYRGGTLRSGARAVWRALEKRFSPTPFVQGVFVVWGPFPQKRHEENRVVYVHGSELVPWLLKQPTRLDAPRRAAIVTALREERDAIAAAR